MTFYYPENLPISHRKNDILSAIRDNQVTIIAGETGSGKTTQLPKICLEAIPDRHARVGCTQPRRIAALTVSSRVADELNELNQIVGCKIRFHDTTGEDTRIKFMTDGILLAEIRSDHLLAEYDILIIDEAHERSLNIDFLLGYLKNILHRRKDLKLIITSATIDTEAFSSHFNNAPVVSIPGKTYPIETRYLPPAADDYGEPESYIDASANAALDIYMNEPPGDILIFLPTEKDILNCTKLLNKTIPDSIVLPLFGRLHSSDQRKIFLSAKSTKIVVATNVAETSITVPGIRYVIDTGLARMAYYNFKAKTYSLPVRKISQASCNQRRGRCGRVGPGVCIRLYSEEDAVQRDEFTIPEIKRSNLAEVILQMIFYRLGNPSDFPFIDPPHSTAINDGYKLLFELGALDDKRKLTDTGRIMAALPIDPCIARIVIEASSNRCLKEIIIIAAVLAIQDPRVKPLGMEKMAEEKHKIFKHPQSDFISLLNIWNLFQRVKGKTFLAGLKKFCKSNYLSFQRMREWIDLHDQMRKIVGNHPLFTLNTDEATYESIHKSLAVGFLRNIAQKKDGKLYQGPANKELMIFPGSGLFDTGSRWIIAASFLETSRLYALSVAAIEPEWLEPIAGKLCSYSWSNPRYHKKSGQVIASEKVSLFGLTLIPARRVDYGKTNLKNQLDARSIFIQAALVEGELIGRYPFLKKNLQLVKKWEEVEHKLRIKNILANDLVLHQFYAKVLPDWVYDKSTLNKFLRRKKNTNFLLLNEGIILERRPDHQELADFPLELKIGSHSFPLTYIFDPADEKDGVTVTIPFELLPTLKYSYFEWLVPGLLKEKITYLLKSLPKKIRKHLVPINATVDTILDDLVLYDGVLLRAIEKSLFKQHKINIRRSDWTDNLPNYLQMRVRLIDITGKEISASRDVQSIVSEARPNQRITKSEARDDDKRTIEIWESNPVGDWNFKELPLSIPLYSSTNKIAGYLYPAVRADSKSSDIKISFINDKEKAEALARDAFRCHIKRKFSPHFKPLKKYCSTTLSGPSSIWIMQVFSTKSEAVEAILDYIVDTHFSSLYPSIFDHETYKKLIQTISSRNLFRESTEIIDKIMSLLRLRRELLGDIGRYQKLALKTRSFSKEVFDEYQFLLDEILPQGFLTQSDFVGLTDKERYLKSLKIRISRADADYTKDAKKAALVKVFSAHIEKFENQKIDFSPSCVEKFERFKMMIHEYRISLFSPEIKTRLPVSHKKLEALMKSIIDDC